MASGGKTLQVKDSSGCQFQITRRDASVDSLGDTLELLLFLPKRLPAPVLVVSHGAGEHKENYVELAEKMVSGGIACVLVDMHGHGKSGGEPHHVRMSEWVEDLRVVLDWLETVPEVDGSRVGGFGLSSGGTAILESAVTDLRWKALIGLDATVCNTLPTWVSLMVRTLCVVGWVKRLFTGKDLRISIMGLLNQVALASDPEINERLKQDPGKRRAFERFPLPGASQAFLVDTLTRVHLIKVPTLVIWGEDDELDPLSTAHSLFSRLECEKELAIIPGNGHAGHLDRNRAQVFQKTLDWCLKYLT